MRANVAVCRPKTTHRIVIYIALWSALISLPTQCFKIICPPHGIYTHTLADARTRIYLFGYGRPPRCATIQGLSWRTVHDVYVHAHIYQQLYQCAQLLTVAAAIAKSHHYYCFRAPKDKPMSSFSNLSRNYYVLWNIILLPLFCTLVVIIYLFFSLVFG